MKALELTMTFAHHDAAHGNERGRREAPLLGTKQARDGKVTSSTELPVSLDGDTPTKVVEDKRLVGLGETKLPRKTSVLDASPAGRTSTSVVTGNQNMVRLSLGHSTCDDPDADLGHELDRHTSARVRALQIVNKLLEILDRVDVVVRRRRDESDASSRVPRARDRCRHLVPRQLSSLARFCALCHFDLELVCVGEVVGRDAEAPRRDLLDRGAHHVAIGERLRAFRVLAALARVRLASEAVHSDGER